MMNLLRRQPSPDTWRLSIRSSSFLPARRCASFRQSPRIYDEPFADTSHFSTILVSRLARQRVTVALTGDGGDELFAGYNRHVWLPRFWSRVKHWPAALRRLAALGIRAPGASAWQMAFDTLGRLRQGVVRARVPVENLFKISRMCFRPRVRKICTGESSCVINLSVRNVSCPARKRAAAPGPRKWISLQP